MSHPNARDDLDDLAALLDDVRHALAHLVVVVVALERAAPAGTPREHLDAADALIHRLAEARAGLAVAEGGRGMAARSTGRLIPLRLWAVGFMVPERTARRWANGGLLREARKDEYGRWLVPEDYRPEHLEDKTA